MEGHPTQRREDVGNGEGRPEIDEWDLVYWRNQRCALPQTEAKLFRMMLSRFGQVVAYKDLIESTWVGEGTAPLARRNLATTVVRLRRRLVRLGLRIETVRGHGYILEPSATPPAAEKRRRRGPAPDGAGSGSEGAASLSDADLRALERRIAGP